MLVAIKIIYTFISNTWNQYIFSDKVILLRQVYLSKIFGVQIFFSGTALYIAPVFVSELSPQSIRGTMISCNGMISAFGILLSGIFGLDKFFGI